MAAAAGETVVLCESESSCDALHGVYATTWAGGAGKPSAGDPRPGPRRTSTSSSFPTTTTPDSPASTRLVAVLAHSRLLIGEPGEDAKDVYARLGHHLFEQALRAAPRSSAEG